MRRQLIGDGRSRRGVQGRQLRGPRPAAQGADQVDPHLARSVRGRESLRRRPVHRNRHAAWPRAAAREHAASGSATARWTGRTRSRRRKPDRRTAIWASISAARSCRRRRRSRSTSAARTPTRSRTSRAATPERARSRMSRDSRRPTRLDVRQRLSRLGGDEGPDDPDVVRRQSIEGAQPGVGAYDLSTRAYGNEIERLQLHAPGSRPARAPLLHEHALLRQLLEVRHATRPCEAPTIRVNDAFTTAAPSSSGGRRACQYSLRRTSTTSAASTRGAPASRSTATAINPTSRRTTSALTRSRASPTYDAGRPRSYTRRIGDPLIDYSNVQAGFYLQDDIRLRRNLTLTPGVRYEAQNAPRRLQQHHAARRHHVVAVQERRRRRCASSYGIFYDWIADQRLRADAARGRVPPAGAQHHQSDLSGSRSTSASRRRRTAISTRTTC